MADVKSPSRAGSRAGVRSDGARDPLDWGELVSRFYGPVFGIALRLLRNEQDAFDAAQEAFCRALRAEDRLDRSRPVLPWLSRIVSNICIDWLRRRGVLHFDGADKLSQVKSDAPSPEHVVSLAADSARLRECIEALPESYRTVVVLKYQASLPNAEIAEAMNISREALRVRLFRAKQMLRRLFTEAR